MAYRDVYVDVDSFSIFTSFELGDANQPSNTS